MNSESEKIDKVKPIPGGHSRRDWFDIADARAWAEEASAKRSWRNDYIRLFVEELTKLGNRHLDILELAAGPAFLASQILEALPDVSYTALDISPAMHELARQRLGKLAEKVKFVLADYSVSGWAAGLPTFDVILSMQSLHEVGHKRNVPALYQAIRKLLRPGGMVLVSDYFAGDGGKSDSDRFMTITEQGEAMRNSGFVEVRMVHQQDGATLWRARQP